ncbi:MAG: triose-phosphate isomerase [Candidatus Pacebacteria bacterium]|nr:triose-phosphate isomerase [Candidatus Paceibacterota bacterium]MBP9840141.1 triose-phosphate isomerase [Candidatus Paceibacterota bacterium]
MLIVANWKAYVEEGKRAKALFALAKRLSGKYKHEIVLAPSFPQLGLLAPGNRTKVRFASQDVSVVTGGAQTGETTAQVVKDTGATYAIIGHSERRGSGEDDAIVALKVQHALAQGLIPILCVGERERDQSAEYLGFVRAQLAAVMAPLSQKERMQVVVAYEPIWAIGKSAAEAILPADLAEMSLYIRKVLGDYLPGKAPAKTRVIYGGSVEPGNIRDLAAAGGIDGFLIGHASVEVPSFASLVAAIS